MDSGTDLELWTRKEASVVFHQTDYVEVNESFLSVEEIERHLRASHGSHAGERNHDVTTQAAIITTFVVLIVVGALGNSLVCFVVARNPRMRTPHNIFIINLAISDLTLCLFTQPFNLYKVLVTDWRLGSFLCKLVSMFAGTNVYVSTISITAIALDRFQVIVYPTMDSVKRFGTVIFLVPIWILSFAMASPLLVFNITAVFELMPGIALYDVCVENPKMLLEKRIYSGASMVVQYLLPVLIVGVAHFRISSKLKYRLVSRNSRRPPVSAASAAAGGGSVYRAARDQMEARRKRKTNRLLVLIIVVFACSWLPLNIFNVLADFNFDLTQTFDAYVKGLSFPVCHILVLCSACANPLLYGWLNDNFRREFVNVLCCCPASSGSTERNQCQVEMETRHPAALDGKRNPATDEKLSENGVTLLQSRSEHETGS